MRVRRHLTRAEASTKRAQVTYWTLYGLMLLPVLVPCAAIAAVGLTMAWAADQVAEKAKRVGALVTINLWFRKGPKVRPSLEECREGAARVVSQSERGRLVIDDPDEPRSD